MDGEGKDAREGILAKIRALLAKTVENGCTEEEAVSAAAMASRLLDKYDLDETDLRRAEPSDYGRRTTPADDDVGARLWKPASAVEKLTGTRYWRHSDGREIAFFGRSSDVEIAVYLLSICERAMRDGSARFDLGNVLYRPGIRKAKRGAFLDGMADSLRRKLEAIHAARQASAAGRDLVVVKDVLVDEEMRRRGIALRRAKTRSSRDFDPSYGRGEAAADAVAFNDGVRNDMTDASRLGGAAST